VDVTGPDGKGFSTSFSRVRGGKKISLTFDDAPRSGSNRLSGMERTLLLIENLAAADSPPVIFFSRAGGIDEEGDIRLRRYQQAGHYIANHSYSHQRISKLGVDGYIADIRKAHEILSKYEGFVPLFRFPFLDEGRDMESRDALRSALRGMGYRNGYVTVDNYDFYMDSLLQKALKQGREINDEQLGKAYVEVLLRAVRFYADIADRYLDHSPVHSLLLHENDLAAMYIDDLIRALRVEGWSMVDALEAFDDPIAAIEPDTLFNNQGRVAAIAETMGAARRELIHVSEDTAWLNLAFEKMGAFGAPYPWLPGKSDLLFSSNRGGNMDIYLLPAGAEDWVNLSNHPAADNYPVWSPDGSEIAFQSNRNGNLDIFVMNADGSQLRQLTDHLENDYLPSWSPNGSEIAFSSWRSEEDEEGASNHIYVMNADGSGQRRLLAESPGVSASLQWSDDGKHTLLTRKTGEKQSDLFLADGQGNILRQLTDDDRFIGSPDFSPGGSGIAFYSRHEDGSRIEVIGTDGEDRRALVSYGESWYPHWSPDGCWLVYTATREPGTEDDLDIRAIPSNGAGDWLTLVSGPGREGEASWRPSSTTPELSCDD
jgi:Tol biopolymer transport system component/peptidoglycan/xylan/chitin deacetylase (PgdA/CDA1 family)